MNDQIAAPFVGTNPACARVFVYGTLRQGRPANHMLVFNAWRTRDPEVTLLGTCRVPGLMADLGAFPGVDFRPNRANGKTVEGDVYEVPAALLPRLDRYEGHPDFYLRTIIDTEFGPAFAYHLDLDPYLNDSKAPPVVEDGVWASPEPLGPMDDWVAAFGPFGPKGAA